MAIGKGGSEGGPPHAMSVSESSTAILGELISPLESIRWIITVLG